MSHGSGAYTRAMRLWASGMPVRDIADQCGVPYHTVMRWAENDRDAFPARRRSARLTDDQKTRIRDLRNLGMSYRAVAREVGVSPATVVKVVRDDGGADVVRGRT